MKTVFKYPLQVKDKQEIQMPVGAEILCVQVQGGTPCLWAKVDTEAAYDIKRTIRIYGTGHHINQDEPLDYIGTFQLENGVLVFHVFELRLP